MMKLSEASKAFYRTVKYDFLDAEGNEQFIELREPTTAEAMKIDGNETNTEKNVAETEAILAECIVGSSFEDEDGKTDNGKEIVKLLKNYMSYELEIIDVWKDFFQSSHRIIQK